MSGSAERFDVAIIGAGLVGAAVAFDLVEAGARVVVLEKEREPGAGVSRSNSGLLHTGFDSKPGELETECILAQGRRWRDVLPRLQIPVEEVGALVLARSSDDVAALEAVETNARRNGVATQRLSARELASEEPNVLGLEAVKVPREAITDPYEMVRRLLSVCTDVRFGCKVLRVEQDSEGAAVFIHSAVINAQFVVNCAGLFADEIHGGALRITPRKGEFIVYPVACHGLIHHALLPIPSPFTKGVLIFPTLYGNVCAGPTAENVESKEDWSTTDEAARTLRRKAEEVVPALATVAPIASWAGLRTVGHPRNYYVEFSQRTPSMLTVAGIRSTGLSGCLGLSQVVLGMLVQKGLNVSPKPFAICVPDEPRHPWWERLAHRSQL